MINYWFEFGIQDEFGNALNIQQGACNISIQLDCLYHDYSLKSKFSEILFLIYQVGFLLYLTCDPQSGVDCNLAQTKKFYVETHFTVILIYKNDGVWSLFF